MAQKTQELAVGAAGTQVTSGATSAQVAIPNNASGVIAKYVRITVASGAAYVKPVLTGTACTANDILVTVGESIVLNVFGYTHIAYLQESAAVKINILPLEIG